MKMTLFGGYFDMDAVRWVQPPSAMTVETCVAFCSQKGFARAALQASYMCWCLTADQVLHCFVLRVSAPLCVCWRAIRPPCSGLLAVYVWSFACL
jgi:hypothetical protein